MKALIDRINQSDLKSQMAALSFFVFGIVSMYVFIQKSDYYFLLLVVENVITAFCFFYRSEASRKANLQDTIAAYICMVIPLFYFKTGPALSPGLQFMSELFLILGVTVVTLATLDLGKSNGVQPAKREVITSGLYRHVNHPMYIGHSISQFSFLLKNPTNIYIYPVSIFLFIYRARIENRLLRGSVPAETA
jgi:protein-S-isoprenylcysteine O-methyltransferase Ste14